MTIRVTLGGEDIQLDVGETFAWPLSYGVRPAAVDVKLTAAIADRLAARSRTAFPTKNRTRERQDSGPLTLLISDDTNNRKVEIKGLYALISERPGPDYNTKILTVVDRRWLFERTFVSRSYNVRKKSGSFRFVGGERQPVQINKLAPDFAYRRATINPTTNKPWAAREVLEQILELLCGKDGWRIDGSLTLADSIEGLVLNDPGPEALMRVMSYIPGAMIYAGYDGRIHVAQLYDQSEIAVFERFGKPNGGDWSVVDRSLERPSTYYVYSDREVELRFDYVEERGATQDVSPTAVGATQVRSQERFQPGREPLWLENVVINPLYFLPLDPSGSRVATMGEPVPVDQFIDAINLVRNNVGAIQFPYGARGFRPFFPNFTVDKKTIRRHWLGNWSYFRDQFALDAQGIYNPEMLKLLAALRNDFRQLYRVLPQWRDKIRALLPERVAILNFETAGRAPAQAYCQYLTKFSQIGYSPAARGALATRNDDYAEDLRDKDVSPFQVSVVDSDMGLIRLSSRPDQTGVSEEYVLGDTEGGTLPAADAANAAVFWHQVYLAPGFKVAIILTATQDVPNDESRLHREEVKIEDAAKLLKLGPRVEGGTRERTPGVAVTANGPPQELFQSAETARYGWKDANANAIRDAFFKPGAKFPDDSSINPEEIKALSVAAAAQHLATRLDRVEGRVIGPLQEISPTGNLRSVTHVVRMGRSNAAVIQTALSAPGEAPAPQIYSLLPEGVRRKVRRLVQD